MYSFENVCVQAKDSNAYIYHTHIAKDNQANYTTIDIR